MGQALAKDRSRTTTDVVALLKRAQTGDQAALLDLRRVFDNSPELWTRVGDLAKQAELSWTETASGGNAVISEAVTRRAAELRQELSGPAPTVLERLLVDRVVTSWIQVHHADRMCTRTGLTSQQQAYLERSLERAQRRYLSSIRSLATVRRLLLPAVQVSIASQQVNVAGA